MIHTKDTTGSLKLLVMEFSEEKDRGEGKEQKHRIQKNKPRYT